MAWTSALAGSSYPLYAPALLLVGSTPRGVAVADLGNGSPDIIVANASDNTVSVLIGNDAGSFAPQVTYKTGQYPMAVAVADLGNRHPDVVTANDIDNTVSVLLGNGDGTFQSQTAYPVGNQPDAVAIANLGNGCPDLVVTNIDGTVSVLIGNCKGAFSPQVTYAVGNSPYGVAVADLNGDGKPDIVTANNGSGTVSILYGNGDGTLQAQQTLNVGSNPSAVAVADLGNGNPDIVVANDGASTLSVLIGNGNGSFANQVIYATAEGPLALAIGDLGNGHPDVAVVTPNCSGNPIVCTNSVQVLLGNGTGTLQTPATYAVGAGPRAVTIAKISGNQTAVIVANSTDNNLSVLDANNGILSSQQNTYAIGQYSKGIAVADLGNGQPDIVTTSLGSDTINVLLGNGDGTFQPQTAITLGSTIPIGIAIADFGNGHPDAVVANGNGSNVSVLLGNGNGSFGAPASFTTGQYPWAVAVADLGNGEPDIVTANYCGSCAGSISVLLGNGNGTFKPQTAYAVDSNPESVAIGDLGNGHPDIVTANSGSNSISVLIGNGDGTFKPQVSYSIYTSSTPPVSAGPVSVAIADLGNGHPDVVVAVGGSVTVGALPVASNNVQVFTGNGDGTLNKTPAVYYTDSAPTAVTIADVNGDGKPDVLVATNTGGAVDVLLGNGGGTLQKPLAYAIGAGAYALAVVDVNQDNWPDILVPNINTNLVTVLLHLNPAPTAAAMNLVVKENGILSGTLSATDAYGLPLTYSLVSNPGHGMLSNFDASTGAFTYTPVTDYLGSDSFKWQVRNSHHATATATADITVSNTPPPVATNGSVTTQENTPVNKTLTATGSGTLTFTIVDKPSHGAA
ncbi:MAG: FG-GAP-like repeat-containing protein, partial [Gammaproteobacteria bacterium]